MAKQSASTISLNSVRVMALIAIIIIFSWPALAAIRTDIPPHGFISPSITNEIAQIFVPLGVFTITGGVIFHGQVQFYLQNGTNKELIPASNITLIFG